MDALWFGCVPVIVADHYVPPLQDLVAWGSIAVSVPERQVHCVLTSLVPRLLSTRLCLASSVHEPKLASKV